MVTNPKVVFIIVAGLLTYGFAGLFAVVYLIVHKADAALIGLVAASTMGAIGNVSGMLSNTRTQATPVPDGTKTTTTTTSIPSTETSTEIKT